MTAQSPYLIKPLETYLRRYHRHEIHLDGEFLDEKPALVVANHGFGGIATKAVPISLSFPWGFSIGVAGMLPYAPLPTKLTTAVRPTMRADPGESPADFAARVQKAMQDRLDELVAGRKPILG